MANFAKIRINFYTDTPPVDGYEVMVEFLDALSISVDQFTITFSDVNQGSGACLIDADSEARADNFRAAAQEIIGTTNFNYTIGSVSANQKYVDIEAKSFEIASIEGWTPNSAALGAFYEIQPPVEAFIVASITQSAAQLNPKMTHVRHSLTFENEQYPIHLRIGDVEDKQAATIADAWFEFPRWISGGALDFVRTVTATSDNNEADQITIPNVSTYEILPTTILSGLTTANATVNKQITNVGDIALIFQYALNIFIDSVETELFPFQSSNVFTELAPGNYRAYITDQLGGVATNDFQVSAGVLLGAPDPYFKIENANSLKAYNSDQGIYDNKRYIDQDYHNVEMQCYAQKVRKQDVLTTQIKTTYSNIAVSVKDVDGVEVAAPVPELKVLNTMLKDKRDCNLWRSGDALKTYITFDGGNQYTPDTTDIIGTYYPQNSALPTWAQSGMYVTIPAGTFEVQAIEYVTSISRWALVVESPLATAGPVAATCQSLYDLESFNIWEFDANLSALAEGYYFMDVTATDDNPNYPDVTWYFEPINLNTAHDMTVVIDYTHSANIEQMDYSTGIVNRLIVPARFIKWRPKIESERLTTDSNDTKILKSVQRRTSILEVVMVPQYLAEKISIATGHDNVKINGDSVVLVEEAEIEDNIDQNNPFYNMTLTMQVGESVTITDSMGIVSESAAVLGISNDEVIGV